MHLTCDGVNDAFYGLVRGIHDGDIPTSCKSSRVGDVLQVDEPVILTYKKPRQRVLFNQARDANPFFHLYESLWMLAGRNDVAPLKYYASGIADIASDDGKIFNGAYGYRWRPTCIDDGKRVTYDPRVRDQIKIIIDHLKNRPDSRRAVLQMWNVEDDLLKIDTTKDVCCNTCVYFSIRKEESCCTETLSVDKIEYVCSIDAGHESPHESGCGKWVGKGSPEKMCLDMTVCNRSNDLIWGMLGANFVHFSILQEYMASCLGVDMGVYNQFTNNLHVYVNNWKPEEWLADYESRQYKDWYPQMSELQGIDKSVVIDQSSWDENIREFVDVNSQGHFEPPLNLWEDLFLKYVAQPMCHAFHLHKVRDYDTALDWCEKIKSEDWKLAATAWIAKRAKNWKEKQGAVSSSDD